MARYVMRVWLTDRPGALGQLASALGEVGTDVIGISILERDGHRVVDELTLEVPEPIGPAEMAAAVNRVEGADVEDIRSLVSRLPYPGSDPLDVAVELGNQASMPELYEVLAHGAATVFSGDWASVIGLGEADSGAFATAGSPPAAAWLGAFLSGTRAASGDAGGTAEAYGPRDVAWALLGRAEVAVVVGRDGPPFRVQERHRLLQLCKIADGRWREIAVRVGMLAHPSGGQSVRSHPAAAS